MLVQFAWVKGNPGHFEKIGLSYCSILLRTSSSVLALLAGVICSLSSGMLVGVAFALSSR